MIKYTLLQIFFLSIISLQKSTGQILYTDLNPDLVISTNGSVSIDVNQDGHNDFVLSCYYAKDAWCMHGNCISTFLNQVTGIDSATKIALAVNASALNCGLLVLDAGYCVGNNYLYAQRLSFVQMGEEMSPCGPPSDVPKYFAFQMTINGNIHYGWFRILATQTSITLYDMAVNLNPNACIITGQTTDISDIIQYNQINLFPNPTNSIITTTLNLPNKQDVEFSISNFLGVEIYHSEEVAESGIFSKEINLKQYSNGIYYLQLKTKNNILIKKIIKE